MPIGNPPVCPKCGLSDRTEMAKMSMDPPVSKRRSPLTYESPWGCFSIGFVLLSFVAFLFFLVVYLINASSPIGRPDYVTGQLLATLVLAILAVFVIIHHSRKAKVERAVIARSNSALEIENAAADKDYKEALYHYNNDLYICRRDGSVFIHSS